MTRLVFPKLQSWHGPTMVTRNGDWTNLATIFGLYGTGLSDLIRSLPPNSTFLDIGANAGLFSMIAAEALPEGQVIAIEPNPQVYRDLLANISLNGVSNVLPINAALGDKTAKMMLAAHPQHTGGAQLGKTDKDRKAVPVAVLQAGMLMDLLGDSHGSILVKIDTEGFELRILDALSRGGILSKVDAVWVEIDEENLSSFGDSSAGIYSLMEDAGFSALVNDPKMPSHYDQHFVRDRS
ncbi:FkbM family methyltransferase [Roseibium album]|uniref:FkbM family methyltransferase n=1 Tax=Roseibium album TaxID=311410 RepID=UPI0024916B31|nr:FkbM family methyltransferase [Roseibium album]